jgi:hypothetical protein
VWVIGLCVLGVVVAGAAAVAAAATGGAKGTAPASVEQILFTRVPDGQTTRLAAVGPLGISADCALNVVHPGPNAGPADYADLTWTAATELMLDSLHLSRGESFTTEYASGAPPGTPILTVARFAAVTRDGTTVRGQLEIGWNLFGQKACTFSGWFIRGQ